MQPQSVQGERVKDPSLLLHFAGCARRRMYFTRSIYKNPDCPRPSLCKPGTELIPPPPRKEAGRTSSQWFFQKPALAGELRAAGGRTRQEKLFFSPAHTETCRLGAASLPLLYSFRHFCMCTQSTLSSPVCLPEGPVQLLQLWTQGKLHSQVHAESFQPLLQSTEGRPGEKKQKNVSFARSG